MTDNTTISTDGLTCISAQDFWDHQANDDTPAYLMIGDQLRLIDYIGTRIEQGDDQFDIGIIDDFELRTVDRYDFVIYVNESDQP